MNECTWLVLSLFHGGYEKLLTDCDGICGRGETGGVRVIFANSEHCVFFFTNYNLIIDLFCTWACCLIIVRLAGDNYKFALHNYACVEDKPKAQTFFFFGGDEFFRQRVIFKWICVETYLYIFGHFLCYTNIYGTEAVWIYASAHTRTHTHTLILDRW